METESEMSERHLRDAEGSVTRQRELIKHLRQQGDETTEAEQWLARLEALVVECRNRHLEL
jgi:hypothetical protein